MELLAYIFFAVALNMDSLGVGFSYGLRRIKLPFASIFLISLMSMVAIIISMLAGQQIGKIMPSAAAMRLGGLILVIIGILTLYQYFKQEKHISDSVSPPVETSNDEKQAVTSLFRLCIFGLIFEILRKPNKADIDMSGTISFREAFLLGIALAMDSMTSGVAVSLIGFSIISTALFVGLGHIILIYIGLSLGKGLSQSVLGRQISALPSLILILIGVTKLY